MRAAWLLALVIGTGCLKDSLQVCGDLACPADAVCDQGRCIPREAIVACAGLADGAPCSTTHISAGSCRMGECVPIGCGDGLLQPGEVCDDGNTANGDTCSANCDEIDECPPIGTTPRYSVLVHQPAVRDCREYNQALDRDVAIALCDGGASVSQGPIDGPLTPIPSLSVASSYEHAYLTPEGDRIFVTSFGTSFAFEERLRGNDDWATTRVIQGGPTFEKRGPPTRGPAPHMMVSSGIGLSEIEINDTDAVRTVRTISATSLGVDFIFDVSGMSPDGLRLMFIGRVLGVLSVYYTDRPDLDADFRPAERVDGLPHDVGEPFMTPNCGRVYFSAPGLVFFTKQL